MCKVENTQSKTIEHTPTASNWHPQWQLVKGMADAGQTHTYIQGVLQGSVDADTARAATCARSMPRGGVEGAWTLSGAIGVEV